MWDPIWRTLDKCLDGVGVEVVVVVVLGAEMSSWNGETVGELTEMTIASISGRSSSLHGGSFNRCQLKLHEQVTIERLTSVPLRTHEPHRRTPVTEHRIKQDPHSTIPLSLRRSVVGKLDQEASMTQPRCSDRVLRSFLRFRVRLETPVWSAQREGFRHEFRVRIHVHPCHLHSSLHNEQESSAC